MMKHYFIYRYIAYETSADLRIIIQKIMRYEEDNNVSKGINTKFCRQISKQSEVYRIECEGYFSHSLFRL